MKGYKLGTYRGSQAVKAAFPTSFECQSARPGRGRDCQPLRQESHTASSLPLQSLLQQPFPSGEEGGGQPPVINLSTLNSFVRHHHFKMVDLKVVADSLRPLDFRDAYFAVPIHPAHQKLLCFQFKNVTYQFKCLPFGLTSAPRVFTKVLKPLIVYVRRLGLRICIYLDDMLILNSQREGAMRDVSLMLHLLENLGFIVNMEKSILFPSQEMEFLGVLVSSIHMSFSLPESKVLNLRNDCRRLLNSRTASQSDLARLIGKMIAAKAAIFQAPLHYRALQHQKSSLDHQGVPLHQKVILDIEAMLDLEWWVTNLATTNSRPVKPLLPDLLIQSDVSGSRWGAVCNRIETRGTWSLHESSLHINCLELLAATYAIKAFTKSLSNAHVLIQMDNTSAIAYVNKMGGSQAGCVRQTCSFPMGVVPREEDHSSSGAHSRSTECHSRCRVSSKTRCSGLEARFRSVQGSESQFRSLYCRPFCQQEQHTVGEILQLSARSLSRAVRCPGSALEGRECLCLPPFQLDQQMSEEDKPRRSNFVDHMPSVASAGMVPHLLQLLTDNPVLLPAHNDLLLDPLGNRHPMIVNNSLPLAGWRLSGNTSLQRAYRKKLQIFSSLPNVDQQMLSTSPVGLSGVAGVANDRLIPFVQL